MNNKQKLEVGNLIRRDDVYWGIEAYNQSKLCNMLFTVELSQRLRDKGVAVNCVHPGNMIYTSMAKRSLWAWPLYMVARPFTKSVVSPDHHVQ